jgi:hypothetical protein
VSNADRRASREIRLMHGLLARDGAGRDGADPGDLRGPRSAI